MSCRNRWGTKVLAISIILTLAVLTVAAGCGGDTDTEEGTETTGVEETQTTEAEESETTEGTESSQEESVEPVTLDMVTFQPKSAARSEIFNEFMQSMAEASGGDLEIDYVGGPESIPGYELAEAVRNGVIDMAMLPAGYYEGLVPMSNVFGLSELTAAEEYQAGFIDAAREAHEKAGLFFFGRADTRNKPEFVWMVREGTRRVESPDDMAGLKAGATSVFAKAFAEGLGMTFVRIPTPEAYTSMERGVVDMFALPISSLLSFGIDEVSDYVIHPQFYVDNTVVIMNPDSWNNLPASTREHMEQYMRDNLEALGAEFQGMFDDYYAQAEEGGMEYVEFTGENREKYLDIAYSEETQRLTEQFPEAVPPMLEMITK